MKYRNYYYPHFMDKEIEAQKDEFSQTSKGAKKKTKLHGSFQSKYTPLPHDFITVLVRFHFLRLRQDAVGTS